MEYRSNDDLLPGFLLDRYRVEEVIGECGCQAVMRVFDTRTKRMLLIKALTRTQAPDHPDDYRQHKESFIRTVDAAARTSFHSHLVAVLDLVYGDDDTLHLVLEYLPGGDLATLLSRGPLPTGKALRIAADAAVGLHAAHEAGVVHCDIRPQTLFLTDNTRAKVGNFGKARLEGDSAYTTALAPYLGAPLYLSPEQENFLRPTTDQYSLGLVLFEMLTGRAYKAMAEVEAEGLIHGLPQAVARVVRRMLARHPDERYATMEEVAKELTTLLDNPDALPSAREGVALAEDRPPGRDESADAARAEPADRTWKSPSAPGEPPDRDAAPAAASGAVPQRAWGAPFRARKAAHAGPGRAGYEVWETLWNDMGMHVGERCLRDGLTEGQAKLECRALTTKGNASRAAWMPGEAGWSGGYSIFEVRRGGERVEKHR